MPEINKNTFVSIIFKKHVCVLRDGSGVIGTLISNTLLQQKKVAYKHKQKPIILILSYNGIRQSLKWKTVLRSTIKSLQLHWKKKGTHKLTFPPNSSFITEL